MADAPRRQSASRHAAVGAPTGPTEPMEGNFPLSADDIFNMVERKDVSILQSFGMQKGMLESLRTDEHNGLPAGDDTEQRKMRYGENKLPEAEQTTLWRLILEACKDKLIILLSICAVISIVFGMVFKDPETGHVDRKTGWIEGAAIIVSVLIVILLSSLSDWQKAKKFQELNKEQTKQPIQVIRAGAIATLDASDVLVGDLINVTGGQRLSVDCIIVEGHDLKTDESAATGESDHVKKNLNNDPFLLSGTNVVEGEGRAIVVGVGVKSFAGHMTMSTRKEATETPLQIKLSRLADMIGWIGIAGAVLTFIVLTVTYVVRAKANDEKIEGVKFLEFIIICITIVVVAIPEGLPLAVTISLAYSMKAMLQDKCLVRVLKSCETMGACTAICSDKTGTLTTNNMTVVQGWVAGENFVIDGYGIQPEPNSVVINQDPRAGPFALRTVQAEVLNLAATSVALNSSAEEVMNNETKKIEWVGSKTEEGLLGWVKRLQDYQKTRQAIRKEDRRIYPFSSARKRMTTLVRGDGKWTIYVKGASEMVLEDCVSFMQPNGEKALLDDNSRKQFVDIIGRMADQGNRTIAVAYSEDKDAGEFPEEEPDPDLTLICILGIQDPIRSEVPAAVKECQRAGIMVRMVTGDNLHTAIAIAKKCGIYDESKGIAMEGRDFRDLAAKDPTRLRQMIGKLQVLARSSPTDKHVLVSVLMEPPHPDCVAVTGDGTNDAPALSMADVGFAMFSGTEVAKGASDMVLMDNNFATVVRATMWGRTVNDNIRKFIQFQLTINICGVMLTLVGSGISSVAMSPLSAVQLLWLNLIMDTLAALALATERPSKSCLNRPPVYKSAPLFSKAMWCFIVMHGVFQLAITLVLVKLGHVWLDVGPCIAGYDPVDLTTTDGNCEMGVYHRTIIFNTFIWLQIFNEINARCLYHELNPFSGLFTRSRPFCVIVPLMIAFQVMAVQLFGRAMGTTPLKGWHWGVCIGIAALELPYGFIVKLISRCLPEYEPPAAQHGGRSYSSIVVDDKHSSRRHSQQQLPMQEEQMGPSGLGPADIGSRRISQPVMGSRSNSRDVGLGGIVRGTPLNEAQAVAQGYPDGHMGRDRFRGAVRSVMTMRNVIRNMQPEVYETTPSIHDDDYDGEPTHARRGWGSPIPPRRQAQLLRHHIAPQHAAHSPPPALYTSPKTIS